MVKNNDSSCVDPWSLLKKIRDIMGGVGDCQDRLNDIVQLLAQHMFAEVCSIYLMRAGEVLELFATHGLNSSAIHKTRLRVGEGIVGQTAAQSKPMNIKDVRNYEGFAYRPETCEEHYHSMLSIPIVKNAQVIGVLVIQNIQERYYHYDDCELLQNVAMILAELLASYQVVNSQELFYLRSSFRLSGTRLSGGLGYGTAVLHESDIAIKKVFSDDPKLELSRLYGAMKNLRNYFDRMYAGVKDRFDSSAEVRDILDVYRLVVHDKGWLKRLTGVIKTGMTAQAAVQTVCNEIKGRLENSNDPYLNDRMRDFENIGNRLLSYLSGEKVIPDMSHMPDNMILVARDLGPCDLLDYDHSKLRGILLEKGSYTCHTSILARSLDIPVLGHVDGILNKVSPGDWIALDAYNHYVFLRPVESVKENFAQMVATRESLNLKYSKARHLTACTDTDVSVRTKNNQGEVISLYINAGLLIDVPSVVQTNADGIGLYRTEIPFMTYSKMPGVQEQTEFYSRVYQQSQGRSVAFRTLDIGGDKFLPYWENKSGENPAMGWRSCRITLDRPYILVQQMSALIRASAGRELKIMFPMIANVAEFDHAHSLLKAQLDKEKKLGYVPSSVKVGVMLEVPSLFWQLSSLFQSQVRSVDFISVGTNDLLQFFFAADRSNIPIMERYDILSPNILLFMKQLLDQCEKANVDVCVCGEAAGQTLEAMTLIALGFRHLSMLPSSIGPVKEMVRSMKLQETSQYVSTLLHSSVSSLRNRLKTFAFDHQVKI